MNIHPVYLSDMRPDFTPFEITCGTIPAYRYAGTLRKELDDGRIDEATAVALLEDMMAVRELEEMIVRETPLGRLSTPEDAARAILFLVSEQGGWITGNQLCASGGFQCF